MASAITRSYCQIKPAWAGTALAAGLIDASSYLIYIFSINEIAFYACAMAFKVAVLLRGKLYSTYARRSASLGVAIILPVILSSLYHQSELIEITKLVAAMISMCVTFLLISRESWRQYIIGLSVQGIIVSCVFLIYALMGRVEVAWDRYMFINDGHPNLGCEIIVTTIIASSFVFRSWLFWPSYAIAFWSIKLMQGRSAILAALLCGGVYLYYQLSGKGRGSRTAVWVRYLAFAFGAAVAAYVAVTSGVFSAFFMADDEYRGMSTGVSGRDEHWSAAFDAFASNPWFGGGINYFDHSGVLEPHSWFLYIIGQFGLSGIAIFGVVGYLLFKIFKNSGEAFARFLPFGALLIFNDRFFSMNVYPFAFYVILVLISGCNVKSYAGNRAL